MNQYLKGLNKIEFIVTYACTGRCIHCSVGDRGDCSEMIDPDLASDAVARIATEYGIKTVMTFGGEPLLHTGAVYRIMRTATELGIERRQVITNGYFSKDKDRIREVAAALADCGVNDLILSVDAFHQQTIPLRTVRIFAEEAKAYGIPIRLQPAWLVSPSDDNIYNVKTREILSELDGLGIPESEGNVIFPEGNALKYLSEYFTDNIPKNPYREDPCDVKCISFEPNGDVLGRNMYTTDVMQIIEEYNP